MAMLSSVRPRLQLLVSWLLLLSQPGATAADTSSSSTELQIPRTASSPTQTLPVASRSSGPNIPHVKRPTTKDIYDDDDLTSPRLCRNDNKSGDTLLRIFRDQCPRLIDSTSKHLPPSYWSPWTHPPACAGINLTDAAKTSKLEFCIFTHAHYRGGISIVATPETASDLASIIDKASISGPSMPPPTDRLPLLDVQEVPGKGLGVIAKEAIPRGTVLLRDNARVLADVRFPQHIRRAQGQALLQKASGRLPVPDDVRGLSRSVKAKPGEARGLLEENVLSTNSFAATVDGVAYMALFPEIARINHACNPTALTRFNVKDLTQKVIAFRDIELGEEITISYTDFGLTHEERQEKLLRRWGFSCTCDLCSGGAEATAASDARRRRVTGLRNEVVGHLQKGKFAVAISAYENELLDLVRTEHLAEHMGEHYEVLARLHLAAGNQTTAGVYAQRALDELETFGTTDTQSAAGSVQELRAFVKAFKAQEKLLKSKTNTVREKTAPNSRKETANEIGRH